MVKSISASLIVGGILALAIGAVALAWPGVTVLALVVLFAVYAFVAAGLEAMRAFGAAKAGPVAGHLLLGLADLAAGVIALTWPGPTALVLVLIVASWAVITGLVEIGAAFRAGESAGMRALFVLGGLVSAAFGITLFALPGIGTIGLALLFGLFNLWYGARAIVQGIELHRSRTTLHSAAFQKLRREPARCDNTAVAEGCRRVPGQVGSHPGGPTKWMPSGGSRGRPMWVSAAVIGKSC